MDIAQTNQLFKALADETRLRILHLLTVGELCVCDIMAIMEQPQSKISRHLSYLRKVGLVKNSKNGLWVFYSLTEPENGVHQSIIDCIHSCFTDVDLLQKDLKKAKRASKQHNCCD